MHETLEARVTPGVSMSVWSLFMPLVVGDSMTHATAYMKKVLDRQLRRVT